MLVSIYCQIWEDQAVGETTAKHTHYNNTIKRCMHPFLPTLLEWWVGGGRRKAGWQNNIQKWVLNFYSELSRPTVKQRKSWEREKKVIWFGEYKEHGKRWDLRVLQEQDFWKDQLKKERLIKLCWRISVVVLVQNKYVKRVYLRKKTLPTTATAKWPFNPILPESLCHC